jgi:hypothetical protein
MFPGAANLTGRICLSAPDQYSCSCSRMANIFEYDLSPVSTCLAGAQRPKQLSVGDTGCKWTSVPEMRDAHEIAHSLARISKDRRLAKHYSAISYLALDEK